MKNIFPTDLISSFKKMVEKHESIVLTCHMRPDGDAIGSTLGLYHLLKRMGKDVNVVIPDRIPRSLSFLPGSKELVVNTMYDPYCARLVKNAQLIIMCDFNTASRQGDLAPIITNAECDKVLIDHHRNPDVKCEVMFSYPEMSSTCELVFRIIAACGYMGMVDKDAATCILTGLITDTRNFTVNCRGTEIYEILIHLLDKGADKKEIIDKALNSTTYDALKLNCFALSERLTIYPQSRCALTCLSKEDLDKYHYEKGDTEGLVNVPLEIPGIYYSVFLRQDPDCVKVSMRSKCDFPVCDICSDLFNGGGHLMAAGGEFKGTLEECRKVFLDHMADYDNRLPAKMEKLEIRQ